ncbi:hypothetical protein AB4Y89_13735 [Terriglobus sp. 2YAB30_2]|uniref:hypothetical protein n=1 Tax=Terriglobus sp. 2YAB30_2 TaxID=3233023 RepID=UPI003F961B07
MDQRRQEEYDRHSVILKGKVVDELGIPVQWIEVDLVPLLEDRSLQAIRTVREWTNSDGEYILRPENTGLFFLAIPWNSPPSSKLPFLPRYYPDSSDEAHAEILDLSEAQHLSLPPIKLSKLQLTRVPVSVSWSNGSPEPEAYLLLNNTRFPGSGVVGSEALHPDKDGAISVPVGFEYRAIAQVECDRGQMIGNAYTPEVTFSTEQTDLPINQLQFTLPGEPCRVWHPK